MKAVFAHLFSPHVFLLVFFCAVTGVLEFLPHQFAGAQGTFGTVLTLATGFVGASHVVQTWKTSAQSATPVEQQAGALLAQLGEEAIARLWARFGPKPPPTPSESTGWTDPKETNAKPTGSP